VRSDPLPRLAAGDQQQAVDAGQCTAQGLRPGVVRLADLHAAVGEVVGLARCAHQSDDLGCGYASGQQLLDGEPSELA